MPCSWHNTRVSSYLNLIEDLKQTGELYFLTAPRFTRLVICKGSSLTPFKRFTKSRSTGHPWTKSRRNWALWHPLNDLRSPEALGTLERSPEGIGHPKFKKGYYINKPQSARHYRPVTSLLWQALLRSRPRIGQQPHCYPKPRQDGEHYIKRIRMPR
jgi:hypothetical protein